ncbi:MAG: cupin domain-containing protein [Phycisphaerales bacterium]|nr:cupin domain-containing protein [Phycisphaerales bacterium]
MTSRSAAYAPKFVPPGEGRALHGPGGDVLVHKITSKDSGGSTLLSDYFLPAGGGTPLHVHTHEDETFFVIEGEVTFFVDGKRLVAGAGATVFGPRGVPHCFKNCSEKAARMVLLVTPGENFERFYEVVGCEGASGGPPSEQEVIGRIIANAPVHGISILGPAPL